MSRGESLLLFVALGWIFATFAACMAWGTHFAHAGGAASTGALALTGALWVLATVLFVVAVLVDHYAARRA